MKNETTASTASSSRPFTLDDLREAVKIMRDAGIGSDAPPHYTDPLCSAHNISFMGMKIIEVPGQPVLKIKDSFEWISDEGRASMNLWLLKTFGTRSPIPEGSVLVSQAHGTIWARPGDAARLAQALRARRG